MDNRWSNDKANEFIARYSQKWSEDIALRVYTARLLGEDPYLVLHGGGNTSVKGTFRNILGEEIPAIYVKASGFDMKSIEPDGFTAIDLDQIRKLRKLKSIADIPLRNQMRVHLFDHTSATPSIEALAHAFIPAKFVDHTHADAILVLTNQKDGESVARKALGDDVTIVPYAKPGFELAKAVAEAYESNPAARGMVLMHHGLITWGETAKESFIAHINLVSKAEDFIGGLPGEVVENDHELLKERQQKFTESYHKIVPIMRGALAIPSDGLIPYEKFIMPMSVMQNIRLLSIPGLTRELVCSPAVTSDHLIRTKALPLWVDSISTDEPDEFKKRFSEALAEYEEQYEAYLSRHESRLSEGVRKFDPKPRVIFLEGLGVYFAGENDKSVKITADITENTVELKAHIKKINGTYEGLPEQDIFDMEYLPAQHAKLAMREKKPLDGHIALVTGAAGAIGAGICRGLLAQGCHVGLTDISEDLLSSLFDELVKEFPSQVLGSQMDVTSPDSAEGGVKHLVEKWGGLDIVVHCAGVAHVSKIEDMDIDAFQRLEKINVEGTLNILKASAPIFRAQGIGGDIVLISTKNVFAPGAGFGAYSATKAASHQLARIASLEFAEMCVRVNMVSPDAVFSDDAGRKSGLWQEVGPDRMKARGLDEKGLEEYYQNRNLLKEKVTAQHCANAVMFFVTRQTPTTGATIPVDGGLPDATPR